MSMRGLAMLVAGMAMAGPLAGQSPAAPALTLDAATRVATAAQAEAVKNNWAVVIAVVDAAGHLVHLRRMDGVQLGSVLVAQEKAKTAALFRRPTKAFAEQVAGGATGILGLPGVVPIEGGVPLLAGGTVIGAVGVSGVTSAQDGVVANAGAVTLSPTAAPR
jgi:uncharacterized protein GlcG (DUF336 family)